MTKTIALLAQGAMGAAVAGRLVSQGARVITSLEGRGAASRARAAAAGMQDTGLGSFGEADIFLSIVPPDTALATAKLVLPHLGAKARRVPYVDCNAVSPATVREVEAAVVATGSAFLDASIIGPPPKPGGRGTVFYVSGHSLQPMVDLEHYGLEVLPLDAGVGAASALKMCYAGIAKGLTGLGAAMILAAAREGAGPALLAELVRSQPEILGLLAPRIPDMLPKAYRWSGEMEEIAAFAATPESELIYTGLARLYDRLAADLRAGQRDAGVLEGFFKIPGPPS